MSRLEQLNEQLEALTPAERSALLSRLVSHDAILPKGASGPSLLTFAGVLNTVAATDIAQAVESECEKIDASQW